MRTTVLYVIALAVLSSLSPGALTQPRHHGLTVNTSGTLMKDGKSYRGIGVNYFSAFSRTLADPKDTSYDSGFANLEKAQIPFCRIMAGGFWPKEQRLYLDDRDEFFRRFDRVIQSAQKHHIGLILSCFWNLATVPDLVGEPVSAWGDPASKTHAHMRNYVREIVSRYRESPAVWGWEFGNEYNLPADLPNAAEQRPPIAPSLGTPAVRTASDEIGVATIRTAFSAFAREVRKYDPYRIIETGDSMPRAFAWHNWKEKTWTHDTGEEQAEVLDQTNPDPIDVVSVHFYEETAAQLQAVAQYARQKKKPLFVGEFGSKGDSAGSESAFREILKTILAARVPLAALWVYDHGDQDGSWNVTNDNLRSYQLKAISEANRKLRGH